MMLSSFFSFASLNICLSIYVSQYNVNAADDGDDVRDQRAFDHRGQRRKIDEGRGAHVDAVRALGAVADDVEPEFAARRFDRLIDLADRNGEAFRREQEVMDHHVDVLFHQVALGQFELRMVGDELARLHHTVEGLDANLPALFHLVHPHQVPRPHVAGVVYGDFEIVSVVARIRLGLADVPIDAAAANSGAGQPPVDRVFALHHAHALRAALEYPVARDQTFALVEELGKALEEFVTEGNERVGDVPAAAADDEIALVQPRAG